MAENTMNEHDDNDNLSVRRRTLLKVAVGAGVAVAAHSAPVVSVVPAYGLTASAGTKDGKCYGIGWSSNNPTGKGWMKVDSQQGLFTAPVYGPTGGPSSDQGNGTATYTWSIAALGPLSAFTLTVVASGCVNAGTATLTPSGMPTGYCLKFYNSGRAINKDLKPSTCGDVAAGSLLAVGNSQASPVTVGNGVAASISAQPNGAECVNGDGLGKVKWTFDIVPCPAD